MAQLMGHVPPPSRGPFGRSLRQVPRSSLHDRRGTETCGRTAAPKPSHGIPRHGTCWMRPVNATQYSDSCMALDINRYTNTKLIASMWRQ